MGSSRLALLLAFALAACAPAKPATNAPIDGPGGVVRAGTPESVNVAAARAKGRAQLFTWEKFAPETFEKAKREHKMVLLDGAAAWCHWCHVMDETTYLDPEIGAILRDRFVAIRVDIDERPDLAERYGAWGWPATILFSPDASEIGKYRGYIPPDEMREVLTKLEASGDDAPKSRASTRPAPVEALAWIGAKLTHDLDGFFDPNEGSWGRRQKSPLGANLAFEALRVEHGEPGARERLMLTIDKQRALLDPIWGGVYQYSTGGTWKEPHYEKLMTYQAANLEGYARAYRATKDAKVLADARAIARYMSSFLSDADGAFLVSQDADVNAHDEKARFVDGDVYYRLDDAHRRALGVPRVDAAVYPHENGLAIVAFVELFEASGDEAILARAKKAADLATARFVAADGTVKRGDGTRYLADAAALGRALARLGEATKDPARLDVASRILDAMERELFDAEAALFFGRTLDSAAVGVFRERDRPIAHNVLAARFYGDLARATRRPELAERGRKLLARLATPANLEERGRMLGDVLLALDATNAYAW